MTINGTVFSVYDIDLSKYTKSILLDGLSIRQFRIRTWTSEADFEYPLNPISRYDIFMSTKNGLSIYADSFPFENAFLNMTDIFLNQFLYRNTFNILTYCSRFGSKKVYCIIEDLL